MGLFASIKERFLQRKDKKIEDDIKSGVDNGLDPLRARLNPDLQGGIPETAWERLRKGSGFDTFDFSGRSGVTFGATRMRTTEGGQYISIWERKVPLRHESRGFSVQTTPAREVMLNLRTKNSTTGEYHEDLYGKELLIRGLELASSQLGGLPQAVISNWEIDKGHTPDGNTSVNLALFDRAKRLGSDEATAARSTWTGQQLELLGYHPVQIDEIDADYVKDDYDVESAVRRVGGVRVRFEREE